MPSKSPAQARLMAAAAHDPAFAKKVNVPQSVARDFNAADAGRKVADAIRNFKPAPARHGRNSPKGNDHDAPSDPDA